jgi:hypothetical protein
MRIPLPGLTIPLAAVVVLMVIAWIGLGVAPAPFPAFKGTAGSVETMPLPRGLPAPVERFYRTVYGERIPVIHSAVMTGRADIRPFGRPTLPARFRFTHVAGKSYRHYIEATFFGLPIMRINESYVDGHSRFETPAGVEEGEPKTEQAAALGMWAELSGIPAVLLTDPRVRWQPFDADTAVLVVPADKTGEERFLVRFDRATGLVTLMEVMRYQRKDSPAKTLWVTNALSWGKLGGFTATTVGSAWWYGADRPWAVFRTEDVVLNADLGAYINSRGR